MIGRSAAESFRRLLSYYPVVVVAGPRQSGKTTLTRTVLPDWPYATLEDPDRTDPRSTAGDSWES